MHVGLPQTNPAQPGVTRFALADTCVQAANGAAVTMTVTINPATGVLTAVPGSPFTTLGLASAGLSLSPTPDGAYLIATSDVSNTITVFRVGLNGGLSIVDIKMVWGTDFNGTTISRDGKLFAIADDLNRVHVFNIAATGSLSPVPGSPFFCWGATSVEFTHPAAVLYVGTTSGIDAFIVAANGSLSHMAGAPFSAPGSNSHQMVKLSPTNQYLFAVDRNTNQIATFALAPNGNLGFIGAVASGSSPRGIVINAAGTLLFNSQGILGGSNSLRGYSIAPTGVLTPLPNPGALPSASSSLAYFEGPPAIEFSANSYSVNENVGTASITINRLGNPAGSASVNFSNFGFGGTANKLDYGVIPNATVTFNPGETSKNVLFAITDDTLSEGNETVNMVLANAVGAALGNKVSSVLTIVDNDAAAPAIFTLGAATYSMMENGGVATIAINRTGTTTSAVSVNYSTVNGTATAGADFIAASGTVFFAAGEIAKTISVSMLDDSFFEGNETMNILLDGPSAGAVLGNPNAAVMTIVDNDPEATETMQFSATNYRASEMMGSVTITVTRTGDVSSGAQVIYTTIAGTATPNGDYTPVTANLVFLPGEASKDFFVGITGDSVFDDGETFTIVLSNPSSGYGLGAPAITTVTIFNK
jgi:hypothetical protein